MTRFRWEGWAFAVALAIAGTGAVRALLRGDEAVAWLAGAAVVAVASGVRSGRFRLATVGRAAAVLLSGPLVSASAAALLRSLPEPSRFGSTLGVLRELGYSPVFFVPFAFAVSWSAMALLFPVAGGARSARGRAAVPLLVWAFAASRDLHGWVFGWGLHDLPPEIQWELVLVCVRVAALSLLGTVAASLPVLHDLHRSASSRRLALPGLLAVAGVALDWGLVLRIWRRALDSV